jgi:hypothetical protein
VHLVGAANYAKGTVSCAKGAADDWMKATPAPRRLVRLVIELAGLYPPAFRVRVSVGNIKRGNPDNEPGLFRL